MILSLAATAVLATVDFAAIAVGGSSTTPATSDAVQEWIKLAGLQSDDFVFPSRIHDSPHLGTRQYARTLEGCDEELGVDPADCGTLSMGPTKPTLTFEFTKQLPRGHPIRIVGRATSMARDSARRAAFWRGRELALSAMSGAGGQPVWSKSMYVTTRRNQAETVNRAKTIRDAKIKPP